MKTFFLGLCLGLFACEKAGLGIVSFLHHRHQKDLFSTFYLLQYSGKAETNFNAKLISVHETNFNTWNYFSFMKLILVLEPNFSI